MRGNAKPRRNAEVEGCRLLKWRSWTNEANFFDRAITTTWSTLFYYLQNGELPIVMKENTVQGHWWKKLYPQNEISLELNELRSFKVMSSSWEEIGCCFDLDMANFLNYLQPHVEGGSDSSNSVFFFLIRQWSRDKDTSQCIHICKGHTQSVDTLAVDSSQTKVNRLHLTKKIVVSYWFCFMLFSL